MDQKHFNCSAATGTFPNRAMYVLILYWLRRCLSFLIVSRPKPHLQPAGSPPHPRSFQVCVPVFTGSRVRLWPARGVPGRTGVNGAGRGWMRLRMRLGPGRCCSSSAGSGCAAPALSGLACTVTAGGVDRLGEGPRVRGRRRVASTSGLAIVDLAVALGRTAAGGRKG